jgi:hypothetical protein
LHGDQRFWRPSCLLLHHELEKWVIKELHPVLRSKNPVHHYLCL